MIYIHVPFCASHCTYCAFYSEFLRRNCAGGSDALCAYVDALCREIAHEALKYGHDTDGPNTLYFGGGTPSLLGLEHVKRILEALREAALVPERLEEFTFEVNPEDIVEKGIEYARGLRELGVNRISMGVQSFDDELLRRMGRRHRNAQSLLSYGILREAGFDNVSIDLIFGFERDFDAEAFRRGLSDFADNAASLGAGYRLPEHISCYQLSVEEDSGLEKMLDKGLWDLPEDDACAERYETICGLLSELGYEHYEISNWAQPRCRALHNSGYWRHVPYLGFGPGAHSLLNGSQMIRRWNNPDLKGYISAAADGDFDNVRGQETLTEEQIQQERIFLGLRTAEGISEHLAGGCWTLPSKEAVENLLGRGDLQKADGMLRMPENKWFISDNIIQNLI